MTEGCAGKSAPLSGLRVLDLAEGAAAFCSKLLADLGAEVIRAGSPLPTGPLPFDPSFLYFNGGKSIAGLDLEDREGRAIFLGLAAGCDVLVESFMPGQLEGLGLGYASLSGLNPGLVIASITGFGQSGPYSRYKSSSLIAAASGGQAYVCGSPGRPPLVPFGSQPYYLASLFAACGILLALRRRGVTGRGQHIDLSLQECCAAALEHVLAQYLGDGSVAARQGSLQWNYASDIFACREGDVFLTFSREWATIAGLAEAEGVQVPAVDAADGQARRDEIGPIRQAISAWTGLHTAGEVFGLGRDMRFPWAGVCPPPAVLENEQLRESGFFTAAELPGSGRNFTVPRPAIVIPGLPAYRWRPPAAGRPLWEGRRAGILAEGGTGKAGGLPLSGMRVLDFTWMLAGPYATRLLADFGAEVIKVQTAGMANGAERNGSPYFNLWNRGKRGITLNLERPEARSLCRALAAECDIVMENFTPRVMEGWGLGYDELKRGNPGLVMVSLCGYGHIGPWRDCPALGYSLQALSGLAHLTSYRDGPPQGVGFAYADHVSGLYAALAAISALRRRDNTGEGAYIEISELEATCSLLGPQFLALSDGSPAAGPGGNREEWERAAPHGCYPCSGDDRWCAIAAFTGDEWLALCSAMGSPGWAGEARFASLQARLENAEELDEKIGGWTRHFDPRELMVLLQAAGVPAAAVNSAADLASDPALAGRGFFTGIEGDGAACTDACPVRLGESPVRFSRQAPSLGQDNGYVFRVLLGMDDVAFRRYVEEGIIA